MKNIEQNYEDKPHWVKEQWFSWYGVGFMCHHKPDHARNVEEILRRYSETHMDVDESITQILDYLEENGLADNTMVVYMALHITL